tara:strand:+ start:183 stop:896 length:714 start_codon:yes stop_codon:yes gene_type:complete
LGLKNLVKNKFFPSRNKYLVPRNCQIKSLNQIYKQHFGFPSSGFFVEVGAYDGESFSNTSCLADHGWSGIYIEPIKEFSEKCRKRHKNNSNVKVLNLAAGIEEKEITIYQGDTLSTTSEDQMNKYKKISWSKHIKFKKQICIQKPLEKILLENDVPLFFDILVVDVEGKEKEVFDSFDLKKWQPKMLIVELEDDHPSFKDDESFIKNIKQLRSFILNNGYEEIYRDEINTIFKIHKI